MTKQSKKGGSMRATKKNNVDEELLKILEEQDVTRVSAVYEKICSIDSVKLRVPNIDAKYMHFVPEHKLLVPTGDGEKRALVEISKHYRHGDYPRRLADNRLRPSVIRHFFVEPDECGKTLTAFIDIEKKTNTESGEVTLILNIYKTENLPATRELCMKTEFSGKREEIPIPDSNLAIAFRKIEPQAKKDQPVQEIPKAVPNQETETIKPKFSATFKVAPAKKETIISRAKARVKKFVSNDGKKRFILSR